MTFPFNMTSPAQLVVKVPVPAGQPMEVQAAGTHVVAWLKSETPEVVDAVREAMGWAEKLPNLFTCEECGTLLTPGGKVTEMTLDRKVHYAKKRLTSNPELAEMLRKEMGWRDIPHRDSAVECMDVFQTMPGIAEDIIRAYLDEHPNVASRLSIGFERQYCEALRLLHAIRVAMNLADAPPKDLAGNVCRKVGLMNDTIRDLEAQLTSAKIDDAHCVKVHCEFSDCSYFAEVRKLNTSGLVNDKEDSETYAEAMIRNLREEREQLDRLGKRRASGEQGPLCELIDEDLRKKLMWLFGTMTELGLRAEPGQTIIEQAEHHLRGLKARCEGLKNDREVLGRHLSQLTDTMDHLRLTYNVGDILAIGQAGDHLRVLKARCDESQQEVERLAGLVKKEAIDAVFRPPRHCEQLFREQVKHGLQLHKYDLVELERARRPEEGPLWRVTFRYPGGLFATRDVKLIDAEWLSPRNVDAICMQVLATLKAAQTRCSELLERTETGVFRDKVRSELLQHAIELCALDGGRGPANAPFWRVTVRLSDPPCPLLTRDVKVPRGEWYSSETLDAVVKAMLDSESTPPSAPEPENSPAKDEAFREQDRELRNERTESGVFRDKVRADLSSDSIALTAMEQTRGPADEPLWRVTVTKRDPWSAEGMLSDLNVPLPSDDWYSMEARNAIVAAVLVGKPPPQPAPEPENIPAKMVADLVWNCQQYMRALTSQGTSARELRELIQSLIDTVPLPLDDPNNRWPTREWWSCAIQSMLDVLKKETPSNV